LAGAAEDKKASDIEILDIRKVSSIADYFVICSGESGTQLKAIVKGIEEKVSKKDLKPPKFEGEVESNWIILDFGKVVAHILGKEEREFYNLEELWSKKAVIYHF